MAITRETRTTGLLLFCGIVVLLSFWTGSAHADARAEYKAGLARLEAQDFAAAARHFRAAVAERAEERHHLLAARRYFPHYYLGLALTEQQNCPAGIAALNESKSQGKIQRSEDLLADLEQRVTSCQQHMAQVDGAYKEAEGVLAEGEEAGKVLEGLRARPALAPLWSRDERGLATRQSEALTQLRAMRQLAATAQQAGDLTALGEAKEGAGGALRALRTLISEARRELGDRSAAAASAFEQVEESASSARQILRGVRDLAPYPPRLAEHVQTVERLLAAIDELQERGQAGELKNLEAQIVAAQQQVLEAARRPPNRLVEAVTSFLRGEYRATLDLLADQGFRDARATAHSCILQAACHHGFHVLAGEQDEVLRRAAQVAARACSELNPPRSARFLSPRFLDFYERSLALSEDELAVVPAADAEADAELVTSEPPPTLPGQGSSTQIP